MVGEESDERPPQRGDAREPPEFKGTDQLGRHRHTPRRGRSQVRRCEAAARQRPTDATFHDHDTSDALVPILHFWQAEIGLPKALQGARHRAHSAGEAMQVPQVAQVVAVQGRSYCGLEILVSRGAQEATGQPDGQLFDCQHLEAMYLGPSGPQELGSERQRALNHDGSHPQRSRRRRRGRAASVSRAGKLVICRAPGFV